MTYTPTEQELIEMGFELSDKVYQRRFFTKRSRPLVIWFDDRAKGEWVADGCPIFPSSKSDIETLIRLFTK